MHFINFNYKNEKIWLPRENICLKLMTSPTINKEHHISQVERRWVLEKWLNVEIPLLTPALWTAARLKNSSL